MHPISRSAGALTAVAAVSALTTAGSDPDPTRTNGVATGIGTAVTTESCAGLVAKIVPLRGAAAGTTFSNLVIVNRGKTSCTLPGQPELDYLGADHLRIPVALSPDQRVPSYRLKPGAWAAMAIGYGTDGNPPCDTKIAYVRVTPPGVVLPFDGGTHCANDGAYEENWSAGSYAAP
ncbi:DUF4232 domain-containing protein [Catenulispora sp. NF23]|uniref:DUF4232 domain-containing protein n=1 Tax=Catenulispora pinistramenti TaxID=2705254 RepID=A0ABS5KTT8_9ACTN|nr:DUF4232 domain-containing protein [Catenulispora pinistramenti]MBS2537075.1 DUF4232 domain-containing protein [Catenulispora pinistramenti]MBS2549478.1 DUF4232 domain-containing protein [Catenulispora pinistramenti]